jgi:FkbM family methyltransferase
MSIEINNFTVLESVYGRFVVNRHCDLQAEALIKTGRPHIDDEIRLLRRIAGTLPEGAVAVDAGANIGLVAVPLAQALKPRGGIVLAFEIQRMLHYALCGSAALNDLDNLHIYPQGLGGSVRDEMMVRLDYGVPQDFGSFSLLQQNALPTERVRIVTLDSIGLQRLDLLKIDVEGMEIEVLMGAQASIQRGRPWCCIEYWKIGLPALKDVFEGSGYELYRIDHLNLLCAPAEKLRASGLTLDAQRV